MRTNTMENDKTLPHITKADKSLQMRVGSGPLDEERVKKCQDVMNNFDGNFTQEAQKYLQELSQAIQTLRGSENYSDQARDTLAASVMQLKANGSTFGYSLIGNLANVMLSFLESISKVDKDVIDIIDAHHKTLSAIVAKDIKGDGGPVGQQMQEELNNVCKRYFAKRKAANAS